MQNNNNFLINNPPWRHHLQNLLSNVSLEPCEVIYSFAVFKIGAHV